MIVNVFAPGTIGNIGPGFDVLGLAVDGFGDEFTFDFSKKVTSINVLGIDANKVPVDPKRNAATIAANALFEKHGQAHSFSLQIRRNLPVSGGMGASAASSVAGAMAAAKFLGFDSTDEILDAALKAERHVAGYHLDNIAPCLLGGVTLVHHVQPPDVFDIPWQDKFELVIFLPNCTLDTKYSRTLLPDNLQTKTWVQQMAQTAGVVLGLIQGDAQILKKSLIDYYAEPQRAPLIPGFYNAKQEALSAGALNFNISGGGPACFAFCHQQTDIERLIHAVPKYFEVSCMVKRTRISSRGAYTF